jgi:hypothetical protein
MTIVPHGWAPLRDFTLRRCAPGGGQRPWYVLGSSNLLLSQTAAGWALSVSTMTMAAPSPAACSWHHSWCQRHGLLNTVWKRRKELLHAILQSHLLEPLVEPAVEAVQLRRIAPGHYKIHGTDILVQRDTNYQKWSVGRPGCHLNCRVPSLSRITPHLRDTRVNCICNTCNLPT